MGLKGHLCEDILRCHSPLRQGGQEEGQLSVDTNTLEMGLQQHQGRASDIHKPSLREQGGLIRSLLPVSHPQGSGRAREAGVWGKDFPERPSTDILTEEVWFRSTGGTLQGPGADHSHGGAPGRAVPSPTSPDICHLL